jgi:hypothetical protein
MSNTLVGKMIGKQVLVLAPMPLEEAQEIIKLDPNKPKLFRRSARTFYTSQWAEYVAKYQHLFLFTDRWYYTNAAEGIYGDPVIN